MLEAARSGEIPDPRIDDAVLKILELKASLRLHKERQVDVGRLATRFRIAEEPGRRTGSCRRGRDSRERQRQGPPADAHGANTGQLPYGAAPQTLKRLVALLVTRDLRGEAGRVFEAEIRARVRDANIVSVDPRTAGAFSDEVLRAVGEAQTVIAAVYVVPEPGERGRNRRHHHVLQAVLERAAGQDGGRRRGKSLPGLRAFPSLATYLCTFSDASVSNEAP
jgi:hypothetical protein